jgi:hypothetical protein
MKSNKEESSGGTGGDDGEANVCECTCEAGAAWVLLFMVALCPDRDGREVESTSEQTRLVATLLTLLNGVGKEREGEGMDEDDDFEA